MFDGVRDNAALQLQEKLRAPVGPPPVARTNDVEPTAEGRMPELRATPIDKKEST
jgi:hypothetical protein